MVPLDSIIQTAGIVTSFARRDLDELRSFEPEGAEYLARLRALVDSLAALPTPVGTRKDDQLVEVASATLLVCEFPYREDVVDDMDPEGLRELAQLMQLLRQAARSLEHHLATDYELVRVAAQARHVHELGVAGRLRDFAALEEVEPEGVEVILRLRKLMAVVAAIDQHSDEWRGTAVGAGASAPAAVQQRGSAGGGAGKWEGGGGGAGQQQPQRPRDRRPGDDEPDLNAAVLHRLSL